MYSQLFQDTLMGREEEERSNNWKMKWDQEKVFFKVGEMAIFLY